MSSLVTLLYFRNITRQANSLMTNSKLNEPCLNNDKPTNMISKLYDSFVNPPKRPIINGM